MTGLKLIGVHTQTHRTSGFSPLKSGGQKDCVETFFFSLLLHSMRSRNDERSHTASDVLSSSDVGSGAEIFDSRIGARTNKDDVDRD